jgi:hypothetical protein
MNLELLLKDLEDEISQENFFRIKEFIDSQVLFDGDFKLFDIQIPVQSASFKILHGLTFIPQDIILLSIVGDHNFYFRYQFFDKTSIYVSTNGPTRLRFLAGKFRDKLTGRNDLSSPYPFVAPDDVVRPSSPGFVYGAVGNKTAGFWLTSEGIPSNVAGIPVLFGDGVVTLASVGAEQEANYTIGIFQHEGMGSNLQQIGEFSITNGGPKRIDLEVPILYTSPNVQLATRLLVGDTLNLKVSLIVKGSAI